MALSYYYSYRESPILGIVIAAVVGIATFRIVLGELEKENGILKILQNPIHKLSIRQITESGVILVLTFAAVFYALSALDPKSFSSKLSVVDSIYFSAITATTVGYGDISPVGTCSRILVIIEIFSALLYVLFVVSIYLNVFLKRHMEESDYPKREDEST